MSLEVSGKKDKRSLFLHNTQAIWAAASPVSTIASVNHRRCCELDVTFPNATRSIADVRHAPQRSEGRGLSTHPRPSCLRACHTSRPSSLGAPPVAEPDRTAHEKRPPPGRPSSASGIVCCASATHHDSGEAGSPPSPAAAPTVGGSSTVSLAEPSKINCFFPPTSFTPTVMQSMPWNSPLRSSSESGSST